MASVATLPAAAIVAHVLHVETPSDCVMAPVSVAEYTVPLATALAAGRDPATPWSRTPGRVVSVIADSLV